MSVWEEVASGLSGEQVPGVSRTQFDIIIEADYRTMTTFR